MYHTYLCAAQGVLRCKIKLHWLESWSSPKFYPHNLQFDHHQCGWHDIIHSLVKISLWLHKTTICHICDWLQVSFLFSFMVKCFKPGLWLDSRCIMSLHGKLVIWFTSRSSFLVVAASPASLALYTQQSLIMFWRRRIYFCPKRECLSWLYGLLGRVEVVIRVRCLLCD